MTDTKFSEAILSNCKPLEPVATEVEPRLERLEGIRAVLFDVYGTLFISASGDIGANSGDHRQGALTATCELFGLGLKCPAQDAVSCFVDEIARVHTFMRGQGVEYPEVDIVEIWRNALPQIAEGNLSEVNHERFSLEYEVRVNPVWPMPQAAETLTNLADRGFELGIVSNAQFFTPLLFPTLLGKSLEDFGFVPQLLYFSYEHRQAKPGNYLYRLATEQLESRGVGADDVLYVGNDMLNDVAAAASVGFRTALFAGDQRSLRMRSEDERVQGTEPNVVVANLSQILDCL